MTAGKSFHYFTRALSERGSTILVQRRTTVMFDDALVAPMPLVRAQHVLQLRTAVNAVRAAAGLAAVTFTPATLTGINVSAAHLVDLRNALAEARTTLGLPAMRDTSLPPAAGVTILAVHVTDLRGGVQ
jgi:hypothetical protein